MMGFQAPSPAGPLGGNSIPDPQRDLKLDPLEPHGILYKDSIGVIMGLYRGSNFQILPGVWDVSLNWRFSLWPPSPYRVEML